MSAFFILCSFLAYVEYVKIKEGISKSGKLFYFWGLCFIFYLLSLMSKQMYVTMPILLLIFDNWPLQRKASRIHLLFEKIPFLIPAIATSIIIFKAQSQSRACRQLSQITLAAR